jgi:hypothetical protein
MAKRPRISSGRHPAVAYLFLVRCYGERVDKRRIQTVTHQLPGRRISEGIAPANDANLIFGVEFEREM